MLRPRVAFEPRAFSNSEKINAAASARVNSPDRKRRATAPNSGVSFDIGGNPPNESRLSCGALKKESSFLRIYARRQLQALVRHRAHGASLGCGPGARDPPKRTRNVLP